MFLGKTGGIIIGCFVEKKKKMFLVNWPFQITIFQVGIVGDFCFYAITNFFVRRIRKRWRYFYSDMKLFGTNSSDLAIVWIHSCRWGGKFLQEWDATFETYQQLARIVVIVLGDESYIYLHAGLGDSCYRWKYESHVSRYTCFRISSIKPLSKL